MTLRRVTIIAVLSAMLSGTIFVQPAAATTNNPPNGVAASEYADQWAVSRNSGYTSYGNDCTNFVSQAMSAGGFRWIYDQDSGAYDWHTGILSWYNVVGFIDAFSHLKRAARITQWPASDSYTPAAVGDVYIYDWGQGDGMSHLALETGFGQRGPGYTSDGLGDYIDQHTNDRYHAPWNYGYLHPDSTINTANMAIYVMTIDWASEAPPPSIWYRLSQLF